MERYFAALNTGDVDAHILSLQKIPAVGLSDKPLIEAGRGTNNGHYIFDYGNPDGYYNLMITSSYPNLLTLPQTTTLSDYAPEVGRQHKEFMHAACTRISGVLFCQMGPKNSRGRVRPDGSVEYTSDPRMIRRFQEGEEICRKILTRMDLKDISTGVTLVSGYALTGATSTPWGPARAAVDPKGLVVNPRFESHDIEGLLICDGSVIPRSGASEACIPVATVAAFAWPRIVQDYFSV